MHHKADDNNPPWLQHIYTYIYINTFIYIYLVLGPACEASRHDLGHWQPHIALVAERILSGHLVAVKYHFLRYEAYRFRLHDYI